MSRYEGHLGSDGSFNVLVDGLPFVAAQIPAKYGKFMGFAWGTNHDGCSELAFALLLHEGTECEAMRHYLDLRREWNIDDWASPWLVTSERIKAWLNQRLIGEEDTPHYIVETRR